MKLGVFSISLAVKNLKTSKEFYEKLGFKIFAGEIENNYLKDYTVDNRTKRPDNYTGFYFILLENCFSMDSDLELIDLANQGDIVRLLTKTFFILHYQ